MVTIVTIFRVDAGAQAARRQDGGMGWGCRNL